MLVTVTGPDPKLVKRELTPNASSKDGQTVLTSTGESINVFRHHHLILPPPLPQFTNSSNLYIFSTTGLIFTALPGFIVTSLLPIYPFLSQQFRSQPSSVNPATANGNFYSSQTTLLPGTRITCSFTKLQKSTAYTEPVQLERILQLKDVRAALRSLLTAPSASKWSLGWGGNSELPLEAQLDLASHVVVLKLPSKATTRKSLQATTAESHHQSINNLSSLQLGTPITAVGCPFGTLVSLKFHNFMINGAISAVLLEKQQSPSTPPTSLVALSDLKLLPGMEGGIVYANSNRKYILGIVGPQLRAPEANAELSVIISATAVLEAVMQNVVTIDGSSPTTKTSTTFTGINDSVNSSTVLESREGLLSEVLKAVVAVEAKGGWASGVLVSRDGHILTNAHALPPISTNSTSYFRVLLDKKWVEAKALYIFSAPIDLAVLKIKNSMNTLQITPMRLGKGITTPGRSVAVVGYPLWRPSSRSITTPVVTVGTAALTVPAAPAVPAVILTTADVHAGASGGAVIDLDTGCLVGLVTSNTRLGGGGGGGGRSPQQPLTSPRQAVNENTTRKQPGILFPNLNYCLGSAVLAPVIEMLTTERLSEGNKLGWRVVERKLEDSGVVEAWHSMRSMGENLGTVPNDQLQRKLPPALAALMESNYRVSGALPRPKL